MFTRPQVDLQALTESLHLLRQRWTRAGILALVLAELEHLASSNAQQLRRELEARRRVSAQPLEPAAGVQRLDQVEKVLRAWHEAHAAESVRRLRDEWTKVLTADAASALPNEDASDTAIGRLHDQLDSLVSLIHRRVPLSIQLPTTAAEQGTGVLIALWIGSMERPADALRECWRLVRREIDAHRGIRIWPHPNKTMPHARILIGQPSNLQPQPLQRTEVLADWAAAPLLVPAGDTLHHLEEEWRPRSLSFEPRNISSQRIGYFYLPAPGTTQLLRMLIRLAWGLCADTPRRPNSPGILYRIFASQVDHLSAARAPSAGPDEASEDKDAPPLVLRDRLGLTLLLPEVFQDATTENAVILDPRLCSSNDPVARWFSARWRIPAGHRQARFYDDQPSRGEVTQELQEMTHLCCSPIFNGLPGWNEFPAFPPNPRRRTARIHPLPPPQVELQAGEHRLVARLIDYGQGGCRIEVQEDHSDALEGILKHPPITLSCCRMLTGGWPADPVRAVPAPGASPRDATPLPSRPNRVRMRLVFQ